MQQPRLPFFVYGTLLPDQPNFFLWGEDSILARQPATFTGGKLYDMGFYPMLVTGNGATAVHGQLITVHEAAYAAVLQRLDELEGYDPTQPEDSAYQRVPVRVTLANGRTQTAWIYLGQPALVADKPEIIGGSWAAFAAASQSELEAWWQTIHTVGGLHAND